MFELHIPEITDIVLPDEVAINTKFLTQVFVTDKVIVIVPYSFYSGDLFAGEV